MQCYTELTPPTAVTHSITLQFIPGQGTNLAVAKSSLLQIFRTKVVSAEIETTPQSPVQTLKTASRYDSRLANDDEGLESSFLGGDNLGTKTDRANSTRLVLVAEVSLPGTITGLARIKTRNTSSGGDALLVALKDARLSLVEWDARRYALTTVSIHYYEQDELQGSPWAANLGNYVNFLAADPGSRCAALKFGPRNLAILPFKQADEDIDMGDWDDAPKPANKDLSGAVVNGGSNIEDTPYSPSFVLRLSNLDPSLLHPVHLAFLHEYREPTFGILSSTQSASNSLGRKDHFTYMVFTLDLQQKASTTLLSITGLPQDLFRVAPLPPPVGGALLVGANELIHIDQSGKPNGVAVNPITKQCTSFSLGDQSDLNLRLEGCMIDVVAADLGEFLVVLNDGRMALLTFRIDGRTVSGLELKMLPSELGGSVIPCRVASLTRLGRNTMFAGTEEGDSVVFGWTRKQSQTSRRKLRLPDIDLDVDPDEEEIEDDEDDLYAEDPPVRQQAVATASTTKGGDLSFRIHDRLLSIAPIQRMTYGQPSLLPGSEEARNSVAVHSELQLVCAVGRGEAGSLAILNLAMQPKVIGRFEFPEARGFWTMSAKKPIPKSLQGDKGGGAIINDYDTSGQYDKFMIVAKVDLDGYETSDVYALTAAGFESLTGTEFEPAAGFTVEAGTLGKDSRIIQVLKSEVRCYDGDLGLSQIIPMLDEVTVAEPRVLTASFADPYLLLVRDDSSIFIIIAKVDRNNAEYELEELEKDDQTLNTTKWLAGCLYTDTSGVFSEERVDSGGKPGIKVREEILMFLLCVEGALHIYRLSDLSKPLYVAKDLSFIPPGLSADFTARKGTSKETISEILIADLGDTTHKSPYLILRHGNDDLTLYQPFRFKPDTGSTSLLESLFFYKLPNATFAKAPEEPPEDDDTPIVNRFLSMRRCSNISGYSTVFLPGSSPSFILKSAKSSPRVIGLQGSGVQAMSSFHTEGCEHGFIYADSHGIARVTQIPSDTSYSELGISVKKVPVGVDVDAVSYHPPSRCYVTGCNGFEPFELPKDDDYHKEWARENIAFKPTIERGTLKLISPITWTAIDTVEMEPCETILCVETLNLEVSESTNERKQLIAVGTALIKGEDFPTRGHVYVYDIAEVIPEPGRPETNMKLKLVAKEDIPRGAVTALSEVGTQGLMLVAQGQKCMVRGLKEDGTLLPVAFMDMSCYVTSVKELPGTGLCLMADAFKGVWFTGYTEEPYKMILLGKSATRLEVVNADFLPDGKELFIVASDADGHIHVLQFDPEHPKSLQGHLLLHRTTFNTGAHIPTSSLLLPIATDPAATSTAPNGTNSNSKEQQQTDKLPPPQLLLLASPTGVLATLRPLSEAAYRRLSSLATQLATTLPHPAGLNPKEYRTPGANCAVSGVDAGIGRSIVDGTMLERFTELGTGRRGEMAGRAGYSGSDEVRAELETVLRWAGMGYF
ncbi:CPSF A subunit region-domain-containing protein [Apodospora peruviana]|uniref:Protein CFT1 n=1 Tax=Apodospora peruviana TaxID=516989 RepID=A0AAE0IQH9_9PEZI|nr:CPSF A subunit region-domain-containing protein [Apodospora peruviana]